MTDSDKKPIAEPPSDEFDNIRRTLEGITGMSMPKRLYETRVGKAFLTAIHDNGLMRDALTGVKNRRFFDNKLMRAIERAGRETPAATVVWIDINNFKKINDQFTHAVGDKVLCHVADTIQNSLRKGDDMARVGGDEFGIILWDTDQEQARAFLQKIRKMVKDNPYPGEKSEIALDISYGFEQIKRGMTPEYVKRTISSVMGGHKEAIKSQQQPTQRQQTLWENFVSEKKGPGQAR